MTPWQARVALGAFLLLATGVTGNALFLQSAAVDGGARKGRAAPRSDPPPHRGPAGPAEGPKRSTLMKPGPNAGPGNGPMGAETNLEVPPDEADVEAVRSIQRELERRGYGPIVTDGVMRPAARAAVMAFEHEHRLPLTGEATQALLKHLVFGVSPEAQADGPPEVRSPHARTLVKDVQRLLASRGYRPGAIDGRLSAATVKAIRELETDQGLEPKGRISAQVVTWLQDSRSAKRPKRH
jgi:peptidoglycan hydrolase-like protein with peptidoglycan-binding domain